MIFFLLLLGLVLVAQIAEVFIPALPWLYNAHVCIVPVIVFYGAMALPFPLMLALALFAGVLLDALTVQVIGGKVEISAGSSILLYGVLAGIMHGLRPLFARGRWEVHCILSGVFTSLIVLALHTVLKGDTPNEQTTPEFPSADSISRALHAVGRRLTWCSTLVDTSGAWSGMDVAASRQLPSDCAHSVCARRDQRP
ncbi:MAG: hypothetical protein DMF44_15160 [Verrucomicrobia bacterium]|nr:MAG: hypothetical protein DMF44_15160 [Verrucomicrobiota bacterium]